MFGTLLRLCGLGDHESAETSRAIARFYRASVCLAMAAFTPCHPVVRYMPSRPHH
jgi:hypothetical protein